MRLLPTLLLSLLLASLCGCQVRDKIYTKLLGPDSILMPHSPTRNPRPAHWTQPVEGHDIPYFFRVNDRLYRSGTMSPQQLTAARDMGIRTVVSLRMTRDQSKVARTVGLGYNRVPIKAWKPSDKQVARVLRIVLDRDCQPVVIQCKFGGDRTGIIVALYRILIDGWTRDEAIAEMVEGGYGFNPFWQNLVKYVRNVDLQKMRAELDLPSN